MTQSLQTETYDMQTTGEEILQTMQTECIGYLQAVTLWLEERNIPFSQFARYIPESIIECISREVAEENMLKPSHAALVSHSTLDFFYG